MSFFKDIIRFLFGLPDEESIPDIAVYSTVGAIIFIAFMLALFA